VKLNLCTVVTGNIEEMRAFYSALLGTEPVSHRNNYFAYTLGATALALWREEEYLAYHSGSGQPLKGGGVLLELEVEDVDSEYSRLRELGLAPLEFPETKPWGHRNFSLLDPDGHTVVLYSTEE
jgi:uncharacterized glyoxalase superfamily protein PhnB